MFVLLLSEVGHRRAPGPRSGLTRRAGAGAESDFLCRGGFWFVFSPRNKTELGRFVLRLSLALTAACCAV